MTILHERLGMSRHAGNLVQDIKTAYYKFAKEPAKFEDFVYGDMAEIMAKLLDDLGSDYDDIEMLIDILNDTSAYATGSYDVISKKLVLNIHKESKYLKLEELTAKKTKDKQSSKKFDDFLTSWISEIVAIYLHEVEHAHQFSKNIDGPDFKSSTKMKFVNSSDQNRVDRLSYISDVYEIDAFATTELARFLGRIHSLDKSSQLKKIAEYAKSIPDYVDNYIEKSDSDILSKSSIATIRKRFMKKIGTGLQKYTESLK